MYNLDEINSGLKSAIENANTQSEIDDIRIHYLGRKGIITELLKGLSSIESIEERKELGKKINEIKYFCENSIIEKKNKISEKEFLVSLEKNKIDITMPGRRPKTANIHLLSIVEEEIVSILTEIGFRVVEGFDIWFMLIYSIAVIAISSIICRKELTGRAVLESN